MLKTLKSFLLGRMFLMGVVTNLVASASIYSQNGNPAPGAEVMFDVTWGDDSGSKSESYTLGIPMAVPAQLPKSIPGSLMTKPIALRKGRSYTLTMGHASTTLSSQPDYDYTLFIDRTSNTSGTRVLNKGVGGSWIVYDEFLMGGIHEEGSYFYAANKKIVFLPVEVKEVWSDQITGVEANGFPDKTGPNEYPYIFMGASSATTFKIKIKLAAEIPAAVRSQILFRWAPGGVLGEFLPATGTSTFSDGTTVQLSSNLNIGLGRRERYLIMAFDENKNGQIDFSEPGTLIKMPHIRRGLSTSIPCQFIPIAKTDYEDSKETLLGWASSPLLQTTLRNSVWHLTAFCNGTVPAHAGSEPTTIKRNETGLTHPVGVAFTPTSSPGDSFKATISKDHDLSIELIESNALRGWMAGEFNSVAEEIRADIIEARGNGNPAQLLSYSIAAKEKSVAFGIIDPDLLLCLGKVAFENPTIGFDVNMFGYVSKVKVSGLANDLYDFDYEGEELLGYPARKAAEVQAGFPSLGNGGKVFKTKIDLGGGNPYANPDLTPYTFFPY